MLLTPLYSLHVWVYFFLCLQQLRNVSPFPDHKVLYFLLKVSSFALHNQVINTAGLGFLLNSRRDLGTLFFSFTVVRKLSLPNQVPWKIQVGFWNCKVLILSTLRAMLYLMICLPYSICNISIRFYNFMTKRFYTFSLIMFLVWFVFFIFLIAMLNDILF